MSLLRFVAIVAFLFVAFAAFWADHFDVRFLIGVLGVGLACLAASDYGPTLWGKRSGGEA